MAEVHLAHGFLRHRAVDGTTLLELLHEDRVHGPGHALELTAGVLDALVHAHRHGIAHQDIKPANVTLSREGSVKVMDFGIARPVDLAGTTLTQTSVVLGTAECLSPEQARGSRWTAAPTCTRPAACCPSC